MVNKSTSEGNRTPKYLGGESNPYLTFRKRLFYPLNYQGACAKVLLFWIIPIFLFRKIVNNLTFGNKSVILF